MATLIGQAGIAGVSETSPGPPAILYTSTGGNTLIAAGLIYSATVTTAFGISSVTDTAGNVWHFSSSASQNPPAAWKTSSGGGSYITFVAWCIAASRVTSVTFADNSGSTDFWRLALSEWTGIGQAVAAGSVTGTGTSAAVTLSLTDTSDLVVGAADSTVGFSTATASWVQFTSAGPSLACGYVQPGVTGSFTTSWGLPSSGDYAAAVAAFGPANALPGLDAATASVPFSPGSSISLTLTSFSPVLSSASALQPTASITGGGVSVNAGLAAATAAALAATASATSGSPPSAVTLAASAAGPTSATLNGTVNPDGLATTWQFEYGLTTAYGTQVPATPGAAGSGTIPVAESFSVPGLAPGTTYHYRLNAFNSAGTSNGSDVTFTTLSASGGATFPGVPLGMKIELLLNGIWTDITSYVYQRAPVQITNGGRPDWTSSLQAAQLTLVLNNRDGRFTPKNTAGAYYPYIARNVQIRVSVNAQSVTGVAYNGYRYWGEVRSWPPKWDPSGHDIYCSITATGIWQRITQLATPLGSAYRRYIVNQSGAAAPQSYWPMEDGTGSTGLLQAASAAGTGPATWAFLSSGSGLNLAASSSFRGSDAIPVLNASAITFTVPAGGTASNNFTRFLLSVPANGDSASGTTNWNLLEVDSAGTVAKFEVYLNYTGTLLLQLRNSGGVVIASGTTTTNVKGQPYLVSAELAPSGGSVLFALSLIKPGAATITETISGTLTSASVGAISKVVISRAMALMDTAAGHLGVFYNVPPTLVSSAYPLNGYTGEFAMDRFTRLCTEMGITAETIGTNTTTAPMGPQVDDTLVNLLQSIEDTDCGLLYESRAMFGLGYRANASMANQAAAAVFPYGSALLDQSLAPVYDDQLIRNNITVTNWTGYKQGAILTSGAMSVLNPPSGIGNGYTYQRSVTAAADTQLPGIANFLLNVGSVDEVRFPDISLKLARIQDAAFFAIVPGLRTGDYAQITGMPSYGGPATAKQLIWGYAETLNAREWTLEFNTVPETPWETGFSPGTVQLAQLPGGSAVSSAAPGAGGSVIANGSITPAMLNSGITIRTLGGNAVTISASAPANPNLNDIWIASATGLISQWNGSSWAPITFNAAATIQAGTITAALIAAGTIVASNIAAGTITAALLASGIVVAGIVDATTVQAMQYIATGTQGEFLAYAGVPALGNLAAAISGFAGTDPYANSFAKGIEIKQGGLILDNQGSPPAAVSGASELYSSTAGRLRYLSSAGADNCIPRTDVNVSQFTPSGGNTIAEQISGALSYQGGEGNQSSEYEIEIDGIITAPTGGSGAGPTLTFALYVDGVSLGASFTIGAVVFPIGTVTLDYTFRFRMAIVTSGASGTVIMAADGMLNRQNVNAGNGVINNVTAGASSGGLTKSFNSTVNHTIAVFSNWSSTLNTGHGITTYRTRITRRM